MASTTPKGVAQWQMNWLENNEVLSLMSYFWWTELSDTYSCVSVELIEVCVS